MDYKKCLNIISNTFNDLGLDYELENESDNSLYMLGIDIEGLQDDVNTNIVLFDSGCLIFNMQFNKIKVNECNLKKIMKFNKASQYFKCILDSKDNAILTFSTPFVNEEIIEGVLKMLLYEFTLEDFVNEFKEIIK